jgi:hypothetical protein
VNGNLPSMAGYYDPPEEDAMKQVDELIKVDLDNLLATDEILIDVVLEEIGCTSLDDMSIEIEAFEGNVILLRVRGETEDDDE